MIRNNSLQFILYAKAYTLCIVEKVPEESNTFRKIVQTKYFSQFSKIGNRLLNVYARKSAKIQHTFLIAIQRQIPLYNKKDSFKRMCHSIQNSIPGVCSHIKDEEVNEFRTFIDSQRNNSDSIDGLITKITEISNDICIRADLEGINILTRIYHASVAMKFSLHELFKSMTRTTTETKFKLLFTYATSLDIQNCLLDIIGFKLSISDLKRLYIQSTNIKYYFVLSFSDLIEKVSQLNIHILSPDSRSRRWIFSNTLGWGLGLATSEQTEKIIKNQENILAHSKSADTELINLHNETISLLKFVNNESESIKSLFKEEDKLTEHLSSVVKEEEELSVQMNQVIEALETLSDVSLELQAIISQINLIPELLNELEKLVSSLISNSLSIDLLPLPQETSHLKYFSIDSIKFIEFRGSADDQGFYVEYSVPIISDTYSVFRIETIPFQGPDNRFYSLDIKKGLTAINTHGYLFSFNPDVCRFSVNTYLCPGQFLDIHLLPRNCNEELLKESRGIGPICKYNLHLTFEKDQRIIHHSTDKAVSIFSPFNDTLVIRCDIHYLNYHTKNESLTEGLNVLVIPDNCMAITSQLAIYPNLHRVGQEIILSPALTSFNISQNIESLTDSLQEIHHINFSQIDHDLKIYINETKIERLQLHQVIQTLSTFKKVRKLTEYTPGVIDFDNPETMGSFVSIIGWIVTLTIISLVTCLCCRFCACCKPAYECCKCLCQCLIPKKSSVTPINFQFVNPSAEYPSNNPIIQSEPNLAKSETISRPQIKAKTKFLKKRKLETSQHSIQTETTEMTNIIQRAKSEPKLFTTLQWYVTREEQSVAIRAILQDSVVQYNWLSDEVETEDNEPVTGNFKPPHYTLINECLSLFKELAPPDIEIDRNGIRYLRIDPQVYYNKALSRYFRKVNNRVVCGYQPPMEPGTPEI